MKLLLTSGGVTNKSIEESLNRLLGKEHSQCRALCIPTAQWGHPFCGPDSVRSLIAATPLFKHFTGLGWASLGVLELTALPTIGKQRWLPWVEAADVLLVDGGDATYLCHWMRESGLADVLTQREDLVWVGVSAGSMVMTPRIGKAFVEWQGAPDDKGLGLVDFSIFPHLNAFASNTPQAAQEWATALGTHAYAIDEQTAIEVVNCEVNVISEGTWMEFNGTAPVPTPAKLRLRKDFRCSTDQLWQHWTNPTLMSKWFGSDPKGVVTGATVDLRLGGGFSVSFQNENGDQYTCNGTYLSLEEGVSFESTWYWTGREHAVERIRVELETTPDGVCMTFFHFDIDPNTTHGYEEGWNSTFEKLTRVLRPLLGRQGLDGVEPRGSDGGVEPEKDAGGRRNGEGQQGRAR